MDLKGKFYFMQLPLEKRLQLERTVREYCISNNIDLRDDIVRELKYLGFSILRAIFTNATEGMLLVNENLGNLPNYKSNKVILYDQKKGLNDARFIIAHEFAHYISEKSQGQVKIIAAHRDHGIGNYHDNPDEQEKDYMAAAMLLPLSVFIREIIDYFNLLEGNEDIDEFLTKNNSMKLEELRKIISKIIKLKQDTQFLYNIQSKYKVNRVLVVRRLDELIEIIFDSENDKDNIFYCLFG